MSADPRKPGGDAPQCPQGTVEAAPERLGRLQRLSLSVIRAAGPAGLTAIETALATGFDRFSIQPRISELRRNGHVVASGQRRRNPSGKTATVWIAREYANTDAQSSHL